MVLSKTLNLFHKIRSDVVLLNIVKMLSKGLRNRIRPYEIRIFNVNSRIKNNSAFRIPNFEFYLMFPSKSVIFLLKTAFL